MNDSMPPPDDDRPAHEILDDAVTTAIQRVVDEWRLNSYEVVGVLTVIAARFAHLGIDHEDER